MAVIPVPYYTNTVVMGHYAVAQRSGEIAATLAATGYLARLRYTDPTTYLVLMRCRIGLSFSTAVTTATQFAFAAYVARGFTTDFTTAMTLTNMASVPNSNVMRKNMSTSLMGANGPGICTTTTMSGQTMTLDAAPFAIATMPTLVPTNSVGTAVAIPVGFSTPMVTLYEWTGLGQHPVVCGLNEGIVLSNFLAGPASGAFGLYVEWQWAEVPAF